jgi:hypothetical protein
MSPTRQDAKGNAISLSVASGLYHDAIHSIFQFLLFHEFAAVARVSRHWKSAVSKTKSRRETIKSASIAIQAMKSESMRRHIAKLDLSGSRIGDAGAASLADAMKLTNTSVFQ